MVPPTIVRSNRGAPMADRNRGQTALTYITLAAVLYMCGAWATTIGALWAYLAAAVVWGLLFGMTKRENGHG